MIRTRPRAAAGPVPLPLQRQMIVGADAYTRTVVAHVGGLGGVRGYAPDANIHLASPAICQFGSSMARQVQWQYAFEILLRCCRV